MTTPPVHEFPLRPADRHPTVHDLIIGEVGAGSYHSHRADPVEGWHKASKEADGIGVVITNQRTASRRLAIMRPPRRGDLQCKDVVRLPLTL